MSCTRTAKAAYDRVTQLIESGGQTEPPAGLRLAELRQVRKLSQAEVAIVRESSRPQSRESRGVTTFCSAPSIASSPR